MKRPTLGESGEKINVNCVLEIIQILQYLNKPVTGN